MPHVTLKFATGRTEEQKKKLVEEIVKSVTSILICEEKAVSVAIEEFERKDWTEKVYKPEILPILDKLYKKPGY